MTPEEEARWYDTHCWSCHQRIPSSWRACCAECGHAWRWRWLLSLHDARLYWRLERAETAWRVPWWEWIRVRRWSRIAACPCCSHDF